MEFCLSEQIQGWARLEGKGRKQVQTSWKKQDLRAFPRY